jgi:hypothetical protein
MLVKKLVEEAPNALPKNCRVICLRNLNPLQMGLVAIIKMHTRDNILILSVKKGSESKFI